MKGKLKQKKKDKAIEYNVVLILEIKDQPIGVHYSTQVNLVSPQPNYCLPGISSFVYFPPPPPLFPDLQTPKESRCRRQAAICLFSDNTLSGMMFRWNHSANRRSKSLQFQHLNLKEPKIEQKQDEQ